ncbi:hypothetical protein HMP09_2654 [Sphingomonas sp. HMP9]|uniref:glycosyltransferase n=1 Tax=Sphingomonas sp. HMP9 TaxID=1517554 RepID=UPI0015964BF1|nr:glycosyltransferase [Sphingomonas sp. HMP9]BCA63420.1 hypothetical protein HMP09_2654 [Sphingomonas sp. HMP9]
MNFGPSDETDLLIFQNYFSPSRHAIFEELGKDRKLVVMYLQSGVDEGRRWVEETPKNYVARRIPTRQIAKVVLPVGHLGLPKKAEVALMVDNNPTNVAMLLLARTVKGIAGRTYLWVEHIPDPSKGQGKTLYQTMTSRGLLRFNDGAASFSAMSDRYLASLGYEGVIRRIPQVVPAPELGAARRRVQTLRRFGYLGSGVARKNVSALRTAVDAILHPDLTLYLAGYDPVDIWPREIACGYIAGLELEAFFNDIDVLVLPSIIDPWGLVVNEALMRGRLVIVSEFCGSSEIVAQIDPRLVCGLTSFEIQAAIEYAISLSTSEVDDRLRRARNVMEGFTVVAAADAFRRL